MTDKPDTSTATDIVKQLQEALEKIASKRRIYNGVVCKDLSADIATDALALIPALLDALQGQEKVVSLEECAKAAINRLNIVPVLGERMYPNGIPTPYLNLTKAVLTAAGVKWHERERNIK